MKNLKRLFALFLLAFCTLFVSAQTEVTVVENNGMNTTLVVTEQGKIYFSTENMYVDAGDGSISTFAVADIRKMTFNGVTGVRNYTEQSNVLLYPNPATSFFKLAAEDGQIMHVQLFSLTGQLLTDIYCQANEAVSISELQSGIYFVKVNDVILKLLKK